MDHPEGSESARAQARVFLGSFLRGQPLTTAMAELDEDVGYWGDRDPVEVLRAARSVLHTHAKVTTEAELSVLLLDLELTPEVIGAVLDVPASEVIGIARREGLDEVVDLGHTPSAADGSRPTGRSRTAPEDVDTDARPDTTGSPRPAPTLGRWLIAVGVALVAVLLIVSLTPDAGGPVEVVEARMTETVDQASGAPGPARQAFTVGENVRLWFRYRASGQADPITITWWRVDGGTESAVYIVSDVALVAGDEGELNVAMSPLYSSEPGSYRVEVARGDEVLVDQSFRIEQAG